MLAPRLMGIAAAALMVAACAPASTGSEPRGRSYATMCGALEGVMELAAETFGSAERDHPERGEFAALIEFQELARSPELNRASSAWAEAALAWDPDRMERITRDMARALEARSHGRFIDAVRAAELVCDEHFRRIGP